MGLFNKKAAPRPEPIKLQEYMFKQADGFEGFKAMRLDRLGFEGSGLLLYERLKAKHGKNALPGDEDYPATISIYPFYNENMEPCFFVYVDKIIAGIVNEMPYVDDIINERFDAVYIHYTKDNATGRYFARMFVRYK